MSLGLQVSLGVSWTPLLKISKTRCRLLFFFFRNVCSHKLLMHFQKQMFYCAQRPGSIMKYTMEHDVMVWIISEYSSMCLSQGRYVSLSVPVCCQPLICLSLSYLFDCRHGRPVSSSGRMAFISRSNFRKLHAVHTVVDVLQYYNVIFFIVKRHLRANLFLNWLFVYLDRHTGLFCIFDSW